MEADTPPLDKTGFALSGLGLSSFVFGLAMLGRTRLARFGFLDGGRPGKCGLYVWHARRAENPVIDLDLLRIPTFRAGVIGASFFASALALCPFSCR